MRGDTAGALGTFESLVDRLPYESFSDNANYQIGRIFYRRANYDSARHYLLITARQFPESEVRADAYYLLGESYSALNDPNNAQYAFSRARKVGATGDLYEHSLYREGVMLYRVGRFRSAIDRLREYVAEHQKGTQLADATFWLGEALYQDRTYDEAERYYNAYLEKFKSDRWRQDALYGLAWSRFQQKDFKGAALAFNDFIKANPNSRLAIEATIRLADSYRLMGNYQQAIDTYESIGKLAGKGARDEEARFQLARVFLQMDEIDRAVATFRQLLKDYPSSSYRDVYAFNIGSIYHEKGMDSLAIAELVPFPAHYQASQYAPEALYIVGSSYYNLEAYDSALVYYRRILDEYPTSAMIPEALDAIKFSLNGLGRGIEAVAIIDSFQIRNPNRIPADSLNFRKAMIILDQGDFNGAIPLLAKLAEDYPQSPLAPEAMVQIGHAYDNLQKPDSALIAYRNTIEHYPTSAAAGSALVEVATIKLNASEWSEAADAFTQYLAQYHDSERVNEARYGVATAKLAMSDTAAALEQLETVLDSGDTKEEDLFLDKSRITAARIYAARGRADRAIDLLASVVARRMDDVAAEALLYRSELLMKGNDLSTALAELRRLTTDFSSFTEYAEPGMLLMGRVYEDLTNYAAARDTYTQLIAQTQDPAIKKEAEGRIKKLKK
jgi:TolA-binding protein